MNKWNGKRFSIYDKEEKQVLGLLNNLGEQTNFNTDEVERLTISDNKKVSHEELKNKYKIDEYANFTGSWFGIKRPTQSNEGLTSTVEQLIDETVPGINSQLGQINSQLEQNVEQLTNITNNLKNDKYNGRNKLKYKTISMTFDTHKTDSVVDEQIASIKKVGADVVICPLVNITSETSISFEKFNDTLFEKYINKVIDSGIKVVMIKPHIVVNWSDSFYRPTYVPTDTNGFFNNWQTVLLHYAQKCTNYNVPYLSLTCEQPNQTVAEHYDKWVTIVDNIRAIAPNLKLLCSMTTGELHSLYKYYIPQKRKNIVDLLDCFGINSYLTFSDKVYDPSTKNITVQDVVDSFFYSIDGDYHIKKLQILSGHYNIPVFVTEVGCMAKVDGLKTLNASGATSYELQAIFYEGLFNSLANCDFVEGFSIWNVQSPFNFSESNQTTTESETVLIKYIKGGIL